MYTLILKLDSPPKSIKLLPSNIPMKAQPADVNWNKPFIDYIRGLWTRKLENDLRTNFEAILL